MKKFFSAALLIGSVCLFSGCGGDDTVVMPEPTEDEETRINREAMEQEELMNDPSER